MEDLARQDAIRWQAGGGDWPDLSDVLLAGERVVFLARGRVRTSRLPRPGIPRPGGWYVIVTDRRLICLRRNRGAARQQLHVLLARIEHAYQRGVLGGKVVVSTHHGKIRIFGLGRQRGGQLVGWLLAASRGEPLPALVPAPPMAALAAPDDKTLTRVEELESVVDRLVTQVRFLEELMQARTP